MTTPRMTTPHHLKATGDASMNRLRIWTTTRSVLAVLTRFFSPSWSLGRLDATAGRLLACVVLVTMCAGRAHAQGVWTVTNLQPASASRSQGFASFGTQQAGLARIGGSNHAGLWTGTAGTWLDLHPAAAARSQILAMSATQQAGFATIGGWEVASLWSGTATSWINLNPAGASTSKVYATSGTRQVGSAFIADMRRAGFWDGSAATWTDLHPLGSTYSEANGISGTKQAGYAEFGDNGYAVLWNGTASSVINLNPPGAAFSGAFGASGTQQVGMAYTAGAGRASLWNGTAASWVDLSPAGAFDSVANATDGTYQVGYTNFGTFGEVEPEHAAIWNGTAASWVDLHVYLPTAMESSRAQGVWSDGSGVSVVGYGFNTVTRRNEALLWTLTNCTNPGVTMQPQSTSTCPTGTVTFTIAASDSAPTYQWQWQPVAGAAFVDVIDGPNADAVGGPVRFSASNARTATVTVALEPGGGSGTAGSHWENRCIVTNSCGSVTSDEATLTVCIGDSDCDQDTDSDDVVAFFTAWDQGEPGGDTDADGDTDSDDIIAFFAAWDSGC